MNRPTPEEIEQIKSECRKRFGHEFVLGIPFAAPVDAYVVVALHRKLDAFSAHVDAHKVSSVNAASDLVATRALFPAPAVLDPLRERWSMLDLEIDARVRDAEGMLPGDAIVSVLTAATAPPGLAPTLKELPAVVAALEQAHSGRQLWSVVRRENGLALILRAPLPEVVTAVGEAAAFAQRTKKGMITWALGYARDLCAWAPGAPIGGAAGDAFDKHFDEKPGRADDLGNALLAMGGAGSSQRAEFL